MLPSLPQRPIARPPCALIAPTICLLIEPASTISTISTVGLSVTRRPPEKRELDAELLQHGADLRPAAVNDHRIDAGLLEQNHVAREVALLGLVPHRVSAIFHDDRRLVVAQHVRQRLHQDFGLFLRAGLKRSRSWSLREKGRALLAGRSGARKFQPPSPPQRGVGAVIGAVRDHDRPARFAEHARFRTRFPTAASSGLTIASASDLPVRQP